MNLKVSGAAMTVGSGINKEGKDIYGLAHYCEHMLFLGSKKYNNATYFVDFITQHNGKFNGFTDFETTGFFFKINTDQFRHGLEIFSRFFIDPLFSAEYVVKEVNSVNSEYERNIQLDSKRKEMVLRDSADPDALFHRFSTGNTKTLLNYTIDHHIDIRERVLEYYNLQYRPDNMKLIVYGNQPIDSSKKLVDEMFKDMKKREDPYEPQKLGKWTKMPWEMNNIGKLILFKTINNHQEIDINFMLDDMFDKIPQNPALYFKFLLNYRGKGSLNDILRSKGLVAGIKTHLRRTHKGFSFFKISGYITRYGIKNLDKVLSVIMRYVKYVREKALDEKLYNYAKKVFNLSFFFNNKKLKLTSFLKSMCNIVWKYDKKHYFTQHKILPEYNEMALKDFGKKLTLKNAVVMVGNKEFNNELTKGYSLLLEENIHDKNEDEILNKKDPFYFTQYGVYNIKKDFISNLKKEDKEFNRLGLKLYEHKKKLPKNISLIKNCPKKSRKGCVAKFKSDSMDLQPKKIYSNSFYEIWYKQDKSFLVAKTNIFIKFIFNNSVTDSKFAAKIRLLIFAINHNLRNFFHQESLRQTSFHLNANSNGFSVKILGYTETIISAAKSFFNNFMKLKFNEGEFELIKDEMKNQLKSQLNLVPALRAYVNFFRLILKDYVQYQSIIDELESLSIADFDSFIKSLFNEMFIKVFFHGTIKAEVSIESFKQIFSHLEKSIKKPITSLNANQINYKNSHADLSGYYIFREKLEKTYNINHAIMNFYQIGKENIKNMIYANLVKALCGYIYFTQLRIKEQLGYTARAKIFSEGNIIYYMILVQGSTKTPDYMDLRIENVIELMRKRIESANEVKFEKFKKIIINNFTKEDKNLKDRTFR